MPSYYEKYLDDIIEQRKRKPYHDMAKRTLQATIPEIERTRGKVGDTLRREGASPLAKARFALDAEGKIVDEIGRVYSQADIQEIARQETLGGEQRNAQLAVDQEKEAKRRAEKSRTQQIWKTASELAGAGIGFAVGGMPGAMAGGKIAGGVSDVVTGLDKTYESPESIVQGAASIISGVSSGLDTLSQENFMKGIQDNTKNLSNLSSGQWKELMFKYQSAIGGTNRDRSAFLDWFKVLGMEAQ